jgi:hypothetical protein
VPQVVFFLRADGAVGHHHADVLPHQAADGVIRIDPRVDAGGRLELGAGRTQFGRDEVRRRLQRGEDYLRSLSL